MTDAEVYRRAAEWLSVFDGFIYESLVAVAGANADALYGKLHWWLIPLPFAKGWNQEVRVIALCLMAAIADAEQE